MSFCWVVNANCELLRLAAVKAEGFVCTAAKTSFFPLARQEIINLPVVCCFVYQDSYGWHPDPSPDFGSGKCLQISDTWWKYEINAITGGFSFERQGIFLRSPEPKFRDHWLADTSKMLSTKYEKSLVPVSCFRKAGCLDEFLSKVCIQIRIMNAYSQGCGSGIVFFGSGSDFSDWFGYYMSLF